MVCHSIFLRHVTELMMLLYKRTDPYGIKYIDACYDSRDQTYWYIAFRPMDICFRTNHFNAISPPPKSWKYNRLYDLTMAFLKGEFKPKSEFFLDARSVDTIIRPILVLDLRDDHRWIVKNTLTGEIKIFDSGDAGKLKAYEFMDRGQQYSF